MRQLSDQEPFAPAEPTPISLESWPRKAHFRFYNDFLEPFFSVTANVDCTNVVRECRDAHRPSTLRLWHGVISAANAEESFRLRVLNGEPVSYPVIHLSPTVLKSDETFAITFLPFLPDYADFESVAQPRLERAKSSRGLFPDEGPRRVDLIHFSMLPWFRFTGLAHARHLKTPDSEPKITLGKFAKEGDRYLLPVSITAHHGLLDGFHVARFLKKLERYYETGSVETSL